MGLVERNLLSLSYGNIIRKDIEGSDGLLPASFEGYNRVQEGDLVLRLTDLQNDQRSLRTGYVGESGIITSAYVTLRPINIDAGYFSYVMHAYDVSKAFYTMGGGLRQGMGFADLKRMAIPLPPLDVQRRIADFLDDQVSSIDRMIDLRRREQQLLETRQRALLADLISEHQADWVPLRRFLRPRQEPDRADLPVLSVYRDHGVIPKSSRTDNFNKTPEDLARYQRVASNDLVVNKMKAWSGSVAVSRFEGIVSPDYLVCEVLEGLDPRYLHLVLRSPLFVAEMGIRSRGIRPNQERLYWEDLSGIAVPVPSLEEQQQTVEAAATTMATVDSIRDVFGRVSDLLQERKRSLITAAVTGEFDASSAASRASDVAVSGAGGAG